MARLLHAMPQISVRLYKTISRSTVDGTTPVSTRYQGKEAYIDLTPYLGEGSSVRTSKSVREPAGAFSLTFGDKPNRDWVVNESNIELALESIYGLIEPMDMIEIRMWSGVGERKSINGAGQLQELPIKMRGFVSSVTRQVGMGNDGKPARQVVVSGQDFGKIWQIYQVIYLHAYAEGTPLLTTYQLTELFGIAAVNAMKADEFARSMIEKVINPHIARFVPETAPAAFKQILTTDSVLVKNGTVNLSQQTMQGSIYDIMRSHLDIGDWNELYIEDREDGVHLVYRPQPYLHLADSDDRRILPDAPEPTYVEIDDSLISQITTSRSDDTVANFFWVTAPRFDMVTDMQRKMASIPADDGTVSLKDYPNAAMSLYGTRPLYAETQLGDDSVTNHLGGKEAAQVSQTTEKTMDWIGKRRQQLMDMHRDNVVLEKGSARVKGGLARTGGELMKAGDYARFRFGNLSYEAYVVAIDDDYQPFVGYSATLAFERGTGFSERIKAGAGKASPWLAEQATRK